MNGQPGSRVLQGVGEGPEQALDGDLVEMVGLKISKSTSRRVPSTNRLVPHATAGGAGDADFRRRRATPLSRFTHSFGWLVFWIVSSHRRSDFGGAELVQLFN